MSGGLTMSQLQERNALLVTENEGLKAQRDALAAENTNLRHLLDMVGETGNANFGLTKLPIPATDAYLSSVRAEGVEMFAHFWEINCGHEKTFIGSEAKAFAAQLRAGKDGE